MEKSKTGAGVAGAFVALLSPLALANAAHSDTTYGPFPVTVKNYSGSSTNSVSYSGQIARM